MIPLFVCGWLLRIRPAPVSVALKRLLRIRRLECTTPQGVFFVDPASNFGFRLLTDGQYEPEMLRAIEAMLGPGGVFVDVGANEGYFSTVAAGIVGLSGRVVAIEPQGRLQEILARNFAQNQLPNVTIAPVAISDHGGRAELHIAPDTNTGMSGLAPPTRYRVPTEMVQTAPLAELLGVLGIGSVDLLKVDVEGHEYEVIMGSPGFFREHRVRAIALELHPKELAARGLDEVRILRFLNDCGYIRDQRFQNLVLTVPEEIARAGC